ncbi:MAG: hypothetical protein RR252_07870 [Longicatena sp.]
MFKPGDKVMLKDVFKEEGNNYYKESNGKILTIDEINKNSVFRYKTLEKIKNSRLWKEHELELVKEINEL